MKLSKNNIYALFIGIVIVLYACTKEDKIIEDNIPTPSVPDEEHKPTPYLLQLPRLFSMPPIPADNPLTVEGVALGRKLFYDPILSANNTQSCASCHNIDFAFSDNGKQFSTGIDNIAGPRNSMPLFNLAWAEQFAPIINGRPARFFWDGGATNLESQVLSPITNPIEMHDNIPNVLNKLSNHPEYPALFKKAFGSDTVTTKRLMQAIAQFERILISGNSRYDKFRFDVIIDYRDSSALSPEERRGLQVFVAEDKGDCFHCHNQNSPFITDFQFKNNGHGGTDSGLMLITNNPADIGKFKTASLRNLVFTAPYMHDGRFQTLEEVVEFYSSGAIRTAPTDPVIGAKHPNGLGLTEQDKSDLIAFLKSMTDSSFILNPDFSRP